ncbi:hypothetical protein [Streptococcus merionis]|uniref:hypothetical protein n=1 Tax=Streptococcus merionis TaxID=400065 RepID=UPI003516C2C2
MKPFKIFLIFTSIVWTVYNLVNAITSTQSVNLVNFLGIVPVVTSLYTEIDWLYIQWNKLRAYFFLKTVNFTAKSYKYTLEDKSISELESCIRELLSIHKYNVQEAFIKKTHEELFFPIESNSGVSNSLVISTKEASEGKIITIKCEYQIAYRDVALFWKSFLRIRNDFFAKFAQAENSKERYDVTIKTDKNKKYSPFYRLTVKHVGKVKVEKFDLKFSDGDLKVITNLNKIYGTSNNYQDIEKLIKEYIPLSKLS